MMMMMLMMTMMMVVMMTIQLRIINICLLMIEDASMDTKFDDSAKSDGATDRFSRDLANGYGGTDGRTDGQTQRLIGMRWTHPKTPSAPSDGSEVFADSLIHSLRSLSTIWN